MSRRSDASERVALEGDLHDSQVPDPVPAPRASRTRRYELTVPGVEGPFFWRGDLRRLRCVSPRTLLECEDGALIPWPRVAVFRPAPLHHYRE